MNNNNTFKRQFNTIVANRTKLVHAPTGVKVSYLPDHAKTLRSHEFTYQDQDGEFCFDRIENIDIRIPLTLYLELIESLPALFDENRKDA